MISYKVIEPRSGNGTPENFFRRKLSNGSTLIGEYYPGLRKVSMGFCIPRGSAHDPKNLPGAHHVLEHILFKSQTNNSRKNAINSVEECGGNLNATTDADCTQVFCDVPLTKVNQGLSFLTELACNPLTAGKEELSVELKAIIEEQRMYEDQLSQYGSDLLHQTLFNKPFGNSTLGTKKSVSAIRVKDLKKLWSESYNPSEFIISMVGGIHPDDFASQLEEMIKPGKRNKDYIEDNSPLSYKFNRKSIKRKGIKQAHIALGFPIEGARSSDTGAWRILDNFLCEGISSVLSSLIREERGLVYLIEHGPVHWRRGGIYEIETSTTQPKNLDLMESLIREGFEKASNLSSDRFEIEKERSLGIEDNSESTLNARRDSLSEAELRAGDAAYFYKTREGIKNVEIEQFQNIARQALKGYSSVRILPA